jgi:ubiquinone/menaquinone biosynthesis C-methylase UbiE
LDNNAAQFIGSIPEHYDRGLGPVIFADYAADMAARVSAVAPKRVLETAAGTGIVTRALRDRLPEGTELTATDLNAPMLDVARAKFKPGERVSFQTADAQALPFGDAAFDAMVCQFGIMFYPDLPKSYREAWRVLVPGGRYFFSVWDAHRYNGFARITDAIIKQTFPVDPPGFYRVPFSCAAIDPIKQDLQEAGFRDIDIAVVPIDKRVSDLSLFATGLIFGNPVIDQIRARGQATPEAVHAQVVEALGREFGTNPAVVPLQTIFYSAIKPR